MKNKIAPVIGVIVVLLVVIVWMRVYVFADFRSHKSNAPNRAALVQIHDAVTIGAAYADVLSVYWRHRTDDLRLSANRPTDWTISMPFELGARDWNLQIKYQDNRVSAVSIYTSDGPRPPDGPQDKLKDSDTSGKAEAADKRFMGQCHCGQVKYEEQGPIVKCSYCDCRGCQRATGTLKAPFVTVRQANFKITAGELAKYRAIAGEKCDCNGVWYFCSKCGTQVYWKGDKGDELDIFAGTLDDPAVFTPKEAK